MALVENSTVIRKSDPDEHERRLGRLKTALKSGAFLGSAAAYAGVRPETLSRWLEEGRRLAAIEEVVSGDPDDPREPSPAEWELIWLAREVDQAEAEAEQRLVEYVEKAAEGEWRAAMALLERRWKDRWAKRSEVTGADGGALQVDDVAERRQQVERALEQVARRLEAGEKAAEAEEDGKAEVVRITRESEWEGEGEGEEDGEEEAG